MHSPLLVIFIENKSIKKTYTLTKYQKSIESKLCRIHITSEKYKILNNSSTRTQDLRLVFSQNRLGTSTNKYINR